MNKQDIKKAKEIEHMAKQKHKHEVDICKPPSIKPKNLKNYNCSNCGNYYASTRENDKYCNQCGYSFENPKGNECDDDCHDWGSNAKDYICPHCLPTKELESLKERLKEIDDEPRIPKEPNLITGIYNKLDMKTKLILDFLSNKECNCKTYSKPPYAIINTCPTHCTPKQECRDEEGYCRVWHISTPSESKEDPNAGKCFCPYNKDGWEKGIECPTHGKPEEKEYWRTPDGKYHNLTDERKLRSDILDEVIEKIEGERIIKSALNGCSCESCREKMGTVEFNKAIDKAISICEALKKENTTK